MAWTASASSRRLRYSAGRPPTVTAHAGTTSAGPHSAGASLDAETRRERSSNALAASSVEIPQAGDVVPAGSAAGTAGDGTGSGGRFGRFRELAGIP